MRFLRGRKPVAEIKLTPEGWVFLVVLTFITIGAVLRNVNLLIVMAGIMYATMFLNWRLAVRYSRSLTATRRIPQQLHANELTSIHWTCEHRLPGVAAWNVVISDSLERAAEADQTLANQAPLTGISNEHFLTRLFGEIFARFRKRQQLGKRADTRLGFLQIKPQQGFSSGWGDSLGRQQPVLPRLG